MIGFPRIVRLNPNIPWKTRGNGAISLQIGIGAGSKVKIGANKDKDFFIYEEKKKDIIDVDLLLELIEEIFSQQAQLNDKNTNSGYVILSSQPKFEIYQKTVKKIVTIREIKDYLIKYRASFKGFKNQRGLIGATASVSWNPVFDKTFELITYRYCDKWGKIRFVDENSVKIVDKKITTTFDNYDYENRVNRIAPNSPCPILYGLRGEDFKDLIAAKSKIISEKIEGWLLFETNQGTDDHIQTKKIYEIRPYESVNVKGTVSANPYTIKGGHVIFSIKDQTGEIDCCSYEPTKGFRKIVRCLVVGDIVDVYGGVRYLPRSINLEKIRVNKLIDVKSKIENPICQNCGKHMKSRGYGQGYKCRICGTKSDKPVFTDLSRELRTGFYEVPICARRHLSKPLKRGF
jgi:tRNA(Ile2)-agmatinylcytidine synthase